MLNLFRMERYRARNAKSTGITLFIMGLLSFLSVYTSTIGMEKNQEINICQQSLVILSNPMLLILWAIMISVYISGEYKNGFVKSIAGQISKRGYLAVSKLLFSIMYTIEMFIVSFVFVLLASFIFGGNNAVIGFSSQVIVLVCVQLLLHIGFSCIFIFIATVTRSSALGIGLGISIGCGITSLLYTGINLLFNKAGIVSGFDIGSYMVEMNVQYMQVGIPSEYVIKAIVVGAISIAVMTFASIQVLNKRDI